MKRIQNLKKNREARQSRENIRLDKQKLQWQLLLLFATSVCLAVVLELLNRRSVVKFISFVWEHPLMFSLNILLVLNTLAVSHLVHRRLALLTTLTAVWLAMGITNFIVICFRTQPFTLADVLLVKDMFSLVTVYFSWFEIIGTALLIIGAIVGLVFLFLRAPRRERVNYTAVVISLVVLTAMSVCFVQLGIRSGKIAQRFTTLKDAYQDYGFAYTFLDTFADLGISRPNNYSPDTVDEIISDIDPEEAAAKPERVIPNIVFVQLESFFDADALSDEFQFSEFPTPYYHKLLTDWPSGVLRVPVVGGGTANTEFEMLTGMNLDFFGAGEYPYYTVLRDTPCETICYVLNRLGYTSTAVHNYMATFYGRNEVYSRLGFNVFESMEYMDDLEYGEIGWAKDEALIADVQEAIKSTPGRDFVLGITVSTHGKYPADYLLGCAEKGIEVYSTPECIDPVQMQNYVNLAKGMDQFLEKFVQAMWQFDEPVICVFYGDHLPALEWDNSCVKSGDLFETQYCIWTNYGARFAAPDMQAYRVSANLLKQLGIEDGVIFQYHQNYEHQDEGPGYLTELEILEYDMLYGDLEVFEGEYPFMPTDLRMGIHEIRVNSADLKYGRLLVKGEHFNEFSTILLDDTELPTAYIDSHTLAAVMDELPEDAESLCVAQVSNEQVELSRTEAFPASRIQQ